MKEIFITHHGEVVLNHHQLEEIIQWSDSEIATLIRQKAKKAERVSKKARIEFAYTNRKVAKKGKGFVYFAKGEKDGLIKIGASINPERRIRSLKHQFKQPFNLVLEIPSNDMFRLEHVYHSVFCDELRGREMFTLTAEQIESVRKDHLGEAVQ